MLFNVVQWRVEIGVFDALCDGRYINIISRSNLYPYCSYFYYVVTIYIEGNKVKLIKLINLIKLILVPNFLFATGI